LESGFNLADEPLKGLGAEPVLVSDVLGAENGADEALEEKGGVLIGLLTQLVLPGHDDALEQQVSDALDHNQRGQICGQPLVDVENLLRVPDHALQVARQHHFVVTARESFAQIVTVLSQQIPLLLQLGNHLNNNTQMFRTIKS